MGYKAPRITYDGDKFDNHKAGEAGYEFSQIPNRLLSYVMREISGNCGNRLKLMIFLMGCGEGFEIHEKTVLNRTGMSQSAYSEARKWLNDYGFIAYKPDVKNPKIKINYDYLWAQIHDDELEEYIAKQNTEQIAREDVGEYPSGSVVIGSQYWSWEKFNSLKATDYFETQPFNKEQIEAALNEYLPLPRKRKK